MKRVLIISPYFPPVNAADMQRVRMSLQYFKALGWETEVITVHPDLCRMPKDELLKESIPAEVPVHQVNTVGTWTSKFGLGSIAWRSLPYFRSKGNELMQNRRFDLVYFSTTQFPVTLLGQYWKKRFGVPFVVDMQDPWHSDYYLGKPRNERPPKYWMVYRLNKYGEAHVMKHVDGLISVSQSYLDDLKQRYPRLSDVPQKVITFGYFPADLEIARGQAAQMPVAAKDHYELLYIGRGGHDMTTAIRHIFKAFKAGLETDREFFSRFRFVFLGTSYAPAGKGKPTFSPIAEEMGIGAFVHEETDRLPFYESLARLMKADGIVIPGSDSPAYTASKIYPYLLIRKPLWFCFSKESSVVPVVKKCTLNAELTLLDDPAEIHLQAITKLFNLIATRQDLFINAAELHRFSAEEMTRKQVELFDTCLKA